MENPILARLKERHGVERPDPAWLLNLLTVLEVSAYSLEDWNGALSAAAGRRVWCPSYKTLTAYLQQLALDVE